MKISDINKLIIINILFILIIIYILHCFNNHNQTEWMEKDMSRWDPEAPEDGYYKVIIYKYNPINNTYNIVDEKYTKFYKQGEKFSFLK